MTSGSLWNYYRHEIDNVSDDASNNKSLKNKKKLIGKREVQLAQPPVLPAGRYQATRYPAPLLNKKVTIPLKYLSILISSIFIHN